MALLASHPVVASSCASTSSRQLHTMQRWKCCCHKTRARSSLWLRSFALQALCSATAWTGDYLRLNFGLYTAVQRYRVEASRRFARLAIRFELPRTPSARLSNHLPTSSLFSSSLSSFFSHLHSTTSLERLRQVVCGRNRHFAHHSTAARTASSHFTLALTIDRRNVLHR